MPRTYHHLQSKIKYHFGEHHGYPVQYVGKEIRGTFIVYKSKHQTKPSPSFHKQPGALPPGKRISRKGNEYYEFRKNRSKL